MSSDDESAQSGAAPNIVTTNTAIDSAKTRTLSNSTSTLLSSTSTEVGKV